MVGERDDPLNCADSRSAGMAGIPRMAGLAGIVGLAGMQRMAGLAGMPGGQ